MLEARHVGPGCWRVWWEPSSWWQAAASSLCPTWRKGCGGALEPLGRVLIPRVRAPSPRPAHPPQPHLLASPYQGQVSTHECRGCRWPSPPELCPFLCFLPYRRVRFLSGARRLWPFLLQRDPGGSLCDRLSLSHPEGSVGRESGFQGPGPQASRGSSAGGPAGPRGG